MDTGYKTTEFWLSAVASLAAVIFPLLIAYGMLTSEEAELWQNLLLAVAAVIVPVVIGSIAKTYTAKRTELKIQSLR